MGNWLRAITALLVVFGTALPGFAASSTQTVGILVIVPERPEPKASDLPGFTEQAAQAANAGDPWTAVEVTQVLDGYRPVYQYTRIAP